jgi:hypothetical protein
MKDQSFRSAQEKIGDPLVRIALGRIPFDCICRNEASCTSLNEPEMIAMRVREHEGCSSADEHQDQEEGNPPLG